MNRRRLSRFLLISVLEVAALSWAPALDARERTTSIQLVDDAASLRLARALRAAGDSRSAVQIYRRLLSKKDAAPELRVEMGEALLDAGFIDDAIGVFLAVPRGSPNEGEAQLALARAQLELNRPQKALEYVERAASLVPNSESMLVSRGVILDCVGRHAEAQVSYRAALALAPTSVAARSDLALSLALTGQYDEAINLLTPIARSVDGTVGERQNLAFVLGLSGDVNAALALSRIDLDEATAQANTKFFLLMGRKGK